MASRPPEDETTVVRGGTTRHVVEEGQAPGAPPPEPFIDPGPSYAAPGEPVAAEEERLTVGPDGQVEQERQRVERRPMRGPFDDFWPALAILLLAALIGLGALWYFTRSEERAVPAVTGQPLDVAVSRLQDEGFKTDIVNRANAALAARSSSSVPRQVRSSKREAPWRSSRRPGPPRLSFRTPLGSPSSRHETGWRAQASRYACSKSSRTSPKARHRPEPRLGRARVEGRERPHQRLQGLRARRRPFGRRPGQADAQAQLADIGLEANVFRVPSIEPQDTVVAQNPVGGQAKIGSAVRLNVSTGTPQ